MRKKILYIAGAFGGGVYTYFEGLLNNVINYYDITIAYAKREETPEDFLKYFDKRIKFIELNYLKREISFKDIRALFEIKNIIKKEKPEIVHVHSPKAGFLTRLTSNTKKIKTFYTPHGYTFLAKNNSKIKRKLFKIIEKIGTMNKSKVIGCSKDEYEEALKLTKNATYVNNGVDLKKITKYIPQESNNLNIRNLTIATTGRICYQKNPKMFNELAKKFPNIKFIWIGDGNFKDELTSENIKITGWKDREDMLQILEKTDIFILTSLWEGLSMSLLEAMAMKKVCVVSNVVGSKSVIKNGRNGFLCKDLREFEEVIKNIQKNKYDTIKISENAYSDVCNIYNTENMAREYMKIYEN